MPTVRDVSTVTYKQGSEVRHLQVYMTENLGYILYGMCDLTHVK